MSGKERKQLSGVGSNTKVKLVNIEGGTGLRQRLVAMGLVPGSVFEVMRNGHPGPFVVKVKNSKVVLGRGMADKILVEAV
jgi:ferrous iron transport protein A